jgi:hypothetical protein
VLEPGAPRDLGALVEAGKLQLIVVARVPYDTKTHLHPPSGTSNAEVWLELELAP